MGFVFDPLVFSGFVPSGSSGGGGGGSLYFKDPVATASALPSGDPAGTVRLVKDTNLLYSYDGTTWTPISEPSTDISQVTYTGTEQASYIDIPGFVFDASVSGFDALVTAITNDGTTTLEETMKIVGTKSNSGPQKFETRIGDSTIVEFNIVLNGSNQLQVQYRAITATPTTINIIFRAISLN